MPSWRFSQNCQGTESQRACRYARPANLGLRRPRRADRGRQDRRRGTPAGRHRRPRNYRFDQEAKAACLRRLILRSRPFWSGAAWRLYWLWPSTRLSNSDALFSSALGRRRPADTVHRSPPSGQLRLRDASSRRTARSGSPVKFPARLSRSSRRPTIRSKQEILCCGSTTADYYVKIYAAAAEAGVRERERAEEQATGPALDRRNAEDAAFKANGRSFCRA